MTLVAGHFSIAGPKSMDLTRCPLLRPSRCHENLGICMRLLTSSPYEVLLSGHSPCAGHSPLPISQGSAMFAQFGHTFERVWSRIEEEKKRARLEPPLPRHAK